MSNLLVNLLLYSSVIAPLLLAFLVWKMPSVETARRWAIGAQTFSVVTALLATLSLLGATETWVLEPTAHWLALDALNAIPLVLFMALCLGITILAPKHVLTPPWLAGILWLSATTSAAYAANNLLVFVACLAG